MKSNKTYLYCNLRFLLVCKLFPEVYTAQKMKFSIKDFSSKCDQIRRKLRIWTHLLEKSLMENFTFCAVLLLNVCLSESIHLKILECKHQA